MSHHPEQYRCVFLGHACCVLPVMPPSFCIETTADIRTELRDTPPPPSGFHGTKEGCGSCQGRARDSEGSPPACVPRCRTHGTAATPQRGDAQGARWASPRSREATMQSQAHTCMTMRQSDPGMADMARGDWQRYSSCKYKP